MDKSMQIYKDIPLLEAIFSEWKDVIGEDYDGYRNHVYRMINCCFKLKICSEEEKQKIIISGAFHDIGIWIDNTLDYIPPSLPPAMAYLKANNLEAWSEEVGLMISEHHKLREYKDDPNSLIELFRKGDLVDFSRGVFKFGIDKAYLKALKSAFPNSGFHTGLVKKSVGWFVKHPLNPAPMMKW